MLSVVGCSAELVVASEDSTALELASELLLASLLEADSVELESLSAADSSLDDSLERLLLELLESAVESEDDELVLSALDVPEAASADEKRWPTT